MSIGQPFQAYVQQSNSQLGYRSDRSCDTSLGQQSRICKTPTTTWCFHIDECGTLVKGSACQCTYPDQNLCFFPSGAPFPAAVQTSHGPTGGIPVSYINPQQGQDIMGFGGANNSSLDQPILSVTQVCHYDSSWFRTADDVNGFINTFRDNPGPSAPTGAFDTAFDTLMQNFCSQSQSNPPGATRSNLNAVTTPVAGPTSPTGPAPPTPQYGELCPFDPYTVSSVNTVGNRMASCSYFIANTPAGDACKAWDAARPDSVTSVAKNRYCGVAAGQAQMGSVGAADCRCINRQLDPNYNLLKGASPAQDACWYAPCSNFASNIYLTTSAQQLPVGTTCPNICEQVVNIYNNRAQEINVDPSQVISCPGFSPTGTGGGGGGGAGGGGISGRVVIIVIVVIVIVIVIVVVAAYAFSRHRRQAVAVASRSVSDAPLPTTDPPPVAVPPAARPITSVVAPPARAAT